MNAKPLRKGSVKEIIIETNQGQNLQESFSSPPQPKTKFFNENGGSHVLPLDS